ncbi:MAG: flagellar basal body P-ring protein FlgI [Gemmatimonadales bacterium]|nr:flagellar basal body P-ring protein FlgI [Gemmatimonadales bacterium]
MTRRDGTVLWHVLAFLALAATAQAQEPRIADLTIEGSAVPQRLVGYGLVVGLDGTGDRAMASRQGGMTVQSVVNLLRRFDLAVPPELLRTANVAAVLVTAEVSPYLRPGGRFVTHVSALGDARSIRGGVLWVTPLVATPGGPAYATAQGALVVDDPASNESTLSTVRWRPRTAMPVNHGVIPDGGVLELEFPKPAVPLATKLWLREPDLATANRIASAINAALGEGKAKVEDPGAIAVDLGGTTDEKAEAMGRVRELRIRTPSRSAIFLDARSGLVVAGGDVAVGAAAIRHGRIGLTIAGPTPSAANAAANAPATPNAAAGTPADSATPAAPPRPAPAEGEIPLRLPVGTSVLEVTAALRAVDAQPREVAAILLALREVGALPVEVIVR